MSQTSHTTHRISHVQVSGLTLASSHRSTISHTEFRQYALPKAIGAIERLANWTGCNPDNQKPLEAAHLRFLLSAPLSDTTLRHLSHQGWTKLDAKVIGKPIKGIEPYHLSFLMSARHTSNGMASSLGSTLWKATPMANPASAMPYDSG